MKSVNKVDICNGKKLLKILKIKTRQDHENSDV